MSDHRAIVGAVVMLGWVTWLKITANDGSETWSITSATETALQCLAGSDAAVSDLVSGTTIADEDLARRYQHQRDRGVVFRRLGPSSFEMTSPNGTTKQARFLCLPETVDPRGPKGK
jgi:hypothetical protein